MRKGIRQISFIWIAEVTLAEVKNIFRVQYLSVAVNKYSENSHNSYQHNFRNSFAESRGMWDNLAKRNGCNIWVRAQG